jgi:hypothetical protein
VGKDFAVLNILWSLSISHEKYIKDGKVLDHSGFKSKVMPGPLTDFSAWVGFCTSLIYFSWDIYRDPLHKKNQISKLIFDILLWA